MNPIGKRLLMAKNDAMMAGHIPIRAYISPNEKRELERWVAQQNRPHVTGMPAQNLNADHMWGMDIVEDPSQANQPLIRFDTRPGNRR